MGIQTSIPKRDSYSHVLVRTDRDASVERAVPMRFASYGENTVSRSVEWDGKRVHAIFLRERVSAKRAWRLGWQNITEQWLASLEASTPEPTSEPQRAIFDSLDEQWKTKRQIVEQSQIKDSEWRTAIRYLLDKGLAEQMGATNRSYRYRRGSVAHG